MEGNWNEARLVPHVAGILIEEVLGMNVEYALDGGDGASASRMYDMLANDDADLALTLWPARFWNTNRSEALTRACPKSSTDRCMATVGNQGYMGRSGWFVPTHVSTVKEKVAEWSTITGLYDPVHVHQLFKARPIPPPRLIL